MLRAVSALRLSHYHIICKRQTSFLTHTITLVSKKHVYNVKLVPSLFIRLISDRLRIGITINQNIEDIKSGSLRMSTFDNNPPSKEIQRKAELLEPCIKLEGEIVKGFGRGSKEIGCPTANFSEEVVDNKVPESLNAGIYLGWARLNGDSDMVEKAVVSVGWNPFYGNSKKSVETHIIKFYDSDFYGQWMKLIICGYIRPELNFNSLDDLVTAIQDDIEHAKSQLGTKEEFGKFKDNAFLTN